MKKVFTINFNFQSRPSSALVTMLSKGNDLQFQVRFTDNELHNILPQNSFTFSLSSGLLEPEQLPNDLAAKLVSTTTDAIVNVVQVEQNY